MLSKGGDWILLGSADEQKPAAAGTVEAWGRWDGVRALIGDDCRLDLVSKSQRRGKEVGMYFGRYEKEDVALRVVRLDGKLALAAHVAGAGAPAYFTCSSGSRGA